MVSRGDVVELTLERSGSWTPPWGEIVPVLPEWETRRLEVRRI